MKTLLIALLTMSTLSAYASSRENLKSYEILNFPQTYNYAIAWGLPGEKIDFSIFNNMNRDEIRDYVSAKKMTNFLVNTTNNEIVSTLDTGFAFFNSGGSVAGGYRQTLELTDILIEGLPYCATSVGVIHGVRFGSNLHQIVIEDFCSEEKNQNVFEIDLSKDDNLNANISEQMGKLLKKGNRHIFENSDPDTEVLGTTIYKGQKLNRIRYEYYIPKSTSGKTLLLEANIKFTLKNKKLVAKVISLDQMIE